MFGIWIVLLFVVLPAVAGAVLTYALSRETPPATTRLALGAAAGAVVGIVVAVALVRF